MLMTKSDEAEQFTLAPPNAKRNDNCGRYNRRGDDIVEVF